MQIVALVWQPNSRWEALGHDDKVDYLRSLDGAIRDLRAAGLQTLGWSEIDKTLDKAPDEGFVGVFGVENAEKALEFEKLVGEAKWYDYFDTTNISINLRGAASTEPSQVYAQLVGVELT